MKIAGIDPSINSSGKCIMDLNDDYSIKSVHYYGYHTTKIRSISGEGMEIAHIGTKYSTLNMFDRQDLAYNILNKDMEDVKHVALEGYAFGKTGSSSLIQLGEFGGGLRKFFYDQGKGIIFYPPTTVKHFATGSGAADKIRMAESIKQLYPHCYPEIFNSLNQYESPHSDLCDAFWICETLRNHLIYDVFGSDMLDEHIKSLLEFKSTKKSHSIVETELFLKKKTS